MGLVFKTSSRIQKQFLRFKQFKYVSMSQALDNDIKQFKFNKNLNGPIIRRREKIFYRFSLKVIYKDMKVILK